MARLSAFMKLSKMSPQGNGSSSLNREINLLTRKMQPGYKF